ncbi:MAG TPA: hypothetical protein VLF95_00745 [Vicinamibacteria bacterium]|nr:hypothetical protein [Vicinamibacteria bacterium]
MNRSFTRGTLVVLAVCVLADVAVAKPPSDVGTLPGFTLSRPKSIDNHGDIVGQVARAGPDDQAALWTRTDEGYSIEALPPLAGLLRGDARAFGRRGAPVGYSYLPGAVSLFRAVVWREDPSGLRVPVDLEPPAGFTDALAFDANRHGLVVGEATNPRETVNGSTVRHAVAWLPEKGGDYEVLDLGVPEGYDVSSASGVNELGEVVGTARRLESDGVGGLLLRATVVVWRPHRHHDRRCHGDTVVLPSDPDLPRNQNPAINDSGLVVVQAERATPGEPLVSRPLFWMRHHRGYAGPYELPLPETFTDGVANDVNDTGLILGTAYVRPDAPGPAVASQAVLWAWSCARKGFATTVLPNPPETALVVAARLNERGDAVGNAPLPAPGTSGGLLWKRKSATRWAAARPLLLPDLEGR